MTRPDDVSQEDWDDALERARALFTDWEGPGSDDIARAIMAARLQEREECAKVAQENMNNGPLDAAAAIRARK